MDGGILDLSPSINFFLAFSFSLTEKALRCLREMKLGSSDSPELSEVSSSFSLDLRCEKKLLFFFLIPESYSRNFFLSAVTFHFRLLSWAFCVCMGEIWGKFESTVTRLRSFNNRLFTYLGLFPPSFFTSSKVCSSWFKCFEEIRCLTLLRLLTYLKPLSSWLTNSLCMNDFMRSLFFKISSLTYLSWELMALAILLLE